MKIRSKINMDWMENPWITIVQGNLPNTRDHSSKRCSKHPATFLLQITQYGREKYVVSYSID